MKQIFRRGLPRVLALVLALCILPSLALNAFAALTDSNIGFSFTKNGTMGSVSSNATGDTITATANAVTWMNNNGSGTLTLTNNSGKEATLSFGYTFTGSAGSTVSGELSLSPGASGNYSKKLAAGAKITMTVQTPATKKTSCTLTLTGLKLTVISSDTVKTNFEAFNGASFTVDGTAVTQNQEFNFNKGSSHALVAIPNASYSFFGWYDVTKGTYLTYGESLSYVAEEAKTIRPVFVPVGTPIFGLGSASEKTSALNTGLIGGIAGALAGVKDAKYYEIVPSTRVAGLDEAIALAQSTNNRFIVLLNNATLPAKADGSAYVIPNGYTLVVPFNGSNTTYLESPYVKEVPVGVNDTNHRPSVYRTMTMAAGAKIDVAGELVVSADHYVSHGGLTLGGQPITEYGKIVMGENSAITVKDGGKLFAWGYITGADSASVTAKSGSKVYEKMQVSDYGGGSITDDVMIPNKIFPFNQYYLQNVEVHETFEYGSKLTCHAGIYGSAVVAYNMEFFGNGGMFQLGEGAVATKYYSNATDRLYLEAEGNLTMNPISIAGYNTEEFKLPFNHNITITLKPGAVATTNQDILVQPGAVIEIQEGATMKVGTGRKLYVMDADNWGNFCYGRYLQQVPFIPRTGAHPNVRQNNSDVAPKIKEDAQIIVDGSLIVDGALYTSAGVPVVTYGTQPDADKPAGNETTDANITSNNKKGVVQLKVAAPANDAIKESTVMNVDTARGYDVEIPMHAAVLTGGKGRTSTSTAGESGETYSYCAKGDVWTRHFTLSFDANGGSGTMEPLTVDECCETAAVKNLFTAPEGKYFVGWNTVAAPTVENPGKAYNIADFEGGAIVFSEFSSDVTLYAQWEVKAIDVVVKGSIPYTVSGQVVTVTHTAPCKVGYLSGESYVAIAAVANEDGSYSFTAPEGATEVLLVVKGDASLDGIIKPVDVTRIKASLQGKSPLSTIAEFAADATGDATIKPVDGTRINASLQGKTPLTW